MATSYDYILAIWLRLETRCPETQLVEELRTYLEAEYQVSKLETVDESEDDQENKSEVTISLQLQLTFTESQMDGDEPTAEAIETTDQTLRAYLEAKYQVNYLELMDDALTLFLLGAWEDEE